MTNHKILLFGAVMSALTIDTFAVTKTVTTQGYVDAMDDEIYETLDTSKQDKIPATGTNSARPGTTVVTYTGTAGTIGERGIYSDASTYNSSTDSNKLVTAAALKATTSFFEKSVATKTCILWIENATETDDNCLLWNLSDTDVYGACKGYQETATSASECCSGKLVLGKCGCASDSDCSGGKTCNGGLCTATGIIIDPRT